MATKPTKKHENKNGKVGRRHVGLRCANPTYDLTEHHAPQKPKPHQRTHSRWRKPCTLSSARKQAALFLAQRMGGAGMAAVCTGILAPSGERGLKGAAAAPFPAAARQAADKNHPRSGYNRQNKVGRKPVTACGQPLPLHRGKRWYSK
ncbi:hypothetical protein [Vogesella sp. AC12]|uniref:hypothetical protein n=1 Tax=Vogesella sp. AC12 TaxID=2950550 RepID=UPI00210E8515|nr:hypothetical protein [Vogesella sp. AC12]MCQ4144006.1 hypothetical protein [Vogesella sp. AC12]